MIIDDFLQYLRAELNYSAHSLKAYESDLRHWADYATGGKPAEFDAASVTTSDLRQYIAWLAASGLAPRTLRRKASALRSLFRFMMKRHGLKVSPAADLVVARLPKELPAVIPGEQIERVLDDAPAPDDFIAVRDHLIIHTFYQTGIRASELCGLLDRDVDTAACQLRVLGKRSKERIVPFGPELASLITRYRSLRACLPQASPTLFVTHRGLSMTYDQVRRAVRAQLDGRVTSPRRSPHTLRHTFATEMLSAGADLNAVRQLLGHQSLETTQIYTHISISEIQQNYQLAHPRAHKSPHHGS